MTHRLTPDDWIAAGLRGLSEIGPNALKAEPLARRLGASKGSFYWHFDGLPAYHAAILSFWQDRAVADIIDALTAIPNAKGKLRHLAAIAHDGAPDRFGGLLVEPAIRAWSLHDPLVAAAVARADAARIAYLQGLLAECNRPQSLAILIYGAYLGLDDLQARGHPDTAGALSALVAQILD